MSDESIAPRPGEVRIGLPERMDAGVYFIGRIRTPWTSRADCPKNSREAMALGDAAISTVEIDAGYREGLRDIERFSHIWLLYWMDRAARDLVVQAPKHLDGTRGVFALRSPARPNPIAMAAARLISVNGLTLRVLGADCLDGTPLVDVKPYFASTDSIPEATRPA